MILHNLIHSLPLIKSSFTNFCLLVGNSNMILYHGHKVGFLPFTMGMKQVHKCLFIYFTKHMNFNFLHSLLQIRNKITNVCSAIVNNFILYQGYEVILFFTMGMKHYRIIGEFFLSNHYNLILHQVCEDNLMHS